MENTKVGGKKTELASHPRPAKRRKSRNSYPIGAINRGRGCGPIAGRRRANREIAVVRPKIPSVVRPSQLSKSPPPPLPLPRKKTEKKMNAAAAADSGFAER